MNARDYFSACPGKIAELRAEYATWEGTPFRSCSAVKGPRGGIDCVGLHAMALFAIGAIPQSLTVPAYPLNQAEQSDESLLRAFFERAEVRARVRRVEEDEPHLDGDFVFPRDVSRPIYRRPSAATLARRATEHHLAVRIGDDIFNVIRPGGYCVLRVSQLTFHRSRYRLLEDLSPLASSPSPASAGDAR